MISKRDTITDIDLLSHLAFVGPGCSSFTGLVMELGPCRVTEPAKDGHVEVTENPWSWNNNASIIFLDQPVGVGYSYYDKGDKGVWTTEAAAKDVRIHLLP